MSDTTSTTGDVSSRSGDLPGWVRDILRCPVGGHPLVEAAAPDGGREYVCAQDCGEPGVRRAYPVRDGIPVLLADDARIDRG